MEPRNAFPEAPVKEPIRLPAQAALIPHRIKTALGSIVKQSPQGTHSQAVMTEFRSSQWANRVDVTPQLVQSPTNFTFTSSGESNPFEKRQGSPVQTHWARQPERHDSHWDTPDRDWIPAFREQRPDRRRRRTLILCFDGTGDCFDDDNSNVVQLISMLKKDNTNEVGVLAPIALLTFLNLSQQMVYYQVGSDSVECQN
jgi:hypothetical protein